MMLINQQKPRSYTIESWAKQNSSLLSAHAGTIKKVTNFKRLGVYVDSKLSWKKHIDYVVSIKLLNGYTLLTFWNVWACLNAL